MKNSLKTYLFIKFAAITILLSGCYEEPDLISDLTVSKGKVPQIGVVWLGTKRSVAASTAVNTGLTTDASTNTNINIEYTSLVPVKEFKVYWAATAAGAQTLISTTAVGSQKYDEILREYVVSLPITAQETKGTTRVFFAEIIGTDGLASAKKSAILTTNK